jgi:two-component system OmpR family sensor kinase/two-component system sensor histidine kinase BaeS
MQAFGAVVLLTVLLLLGLILFIIGPVMLSGQLFTPIQGNLALAYYQGRGSWQGVETLLTNPTHTRLYGEAAGWDNALLLDAEDRVLIDGGRTDTARIGQPYTFGPRDILMPLRAQGQTVGTLVIEGTSFTLVAVVWDIARGIAVPVIIISFFTGTLTLLIGFLLARRVVTPLADVIAAAHSVTTGDLSARAPARGPGDLRTLSDSFNRMAETLERNDRERNNWLADIAHELRTPLTVMRGKLEGMVDGVYRADEEHVAPVLAQTYVLERLVDDLHLLTLAEARQLQLDMRAVDLGELAQRAASLFEAEADEHGIRLRVSVEPQLPAVHADPQRVEQVIGNLVSNALRYIPERGCVEITARRVSEGVELAVSDDGPGAPEADLPRLFDRFWRGDKSRARAAGGAGLGLAIARQLVEAQGGIITASNRPGGGLRVAFVMRSGAA